MVRYNYYAINEGSELYEAYMNLKEKKERLIPCAVEFLFKCGIKIEDMCFKIPNNFKEEISRDLYIKPVGKYNAKWFMKKSDTNCLKIKNTSDLGKKWRDAVNSEFGDFDNAVKVRFPNIKLNYYYFSISRGGSLICAINQKVDFKPADSNEVDYMEYMKSEFDKLEGILNVG